MRHTAVAIIFQIPVDTDCRRICSRGLYHQFLADSLQYETITVRRRNFLELNMFSQPWGTAGHKFAYAIERSGIASAYYTQQHEKNRKELF